MGNLSSDFKRNPQAFTARKKAGWSRVEIAEALGHASTRTGGRYARKQSGGGGTSSMTAVWASGEVREPGRTLPEKVSEMAPSEPDNPDFSEP